MKKRFIFLVFTLFLMTCVTYVYATDNNDDLVWKAEAEYEAYINQLPVYDTHNAYGIYVGSVDDLEHYADIIIEATVLPGRQNITFRGLQGYTRTELEIQKVYGGDVAVGDVIVVREPYAVIDHYRDISDLTLDKEPMLICDDGYRPAKAGQTYLFFLTKSDPEYWGEEQYYSLYPILPDIQFR